MPYTPPKQSKVSAMGSKFAPGDADLPAVLRGYTSESMPGSPKGPRVGVVGDSNPPPPVRRVGKATQRPSVVGRG